MKKTFKKRAFISAIAMLIVSAIVLTSATFAWFSMAKKVQVEAMDLNVTAPDGVQISANTSAWTTTVTRADLEGTSTTRFVADTDHTNHFPDNLSPSSSYFYVSKTLPEFFSGSIDDTGKATITKAADTTGGYVVFDLFVKVSAAQKVYWNETTVTCTDNPDVVKAMRVAVAYCGVGDKDAAKTVLNTSVSTTNVYEPSSKSHTQAAIDAGLATEGTALETKYSRTDGTNISTTANTIIPASNTIHVASLQSGLLTDDNFAANGFFNAAAGINRIRVYLWMEGNDVDCANDVAGSTINFNLVLTIA